MSTSCCLGPYRPIYFVVWVLCAFHVSVINSCYHWDTLLESKGMFKKCGLKSSGYALLDKMYHEIPTLSHSVLFAGYEVLQIPTPRGTLTISQNNKSLILNWNPNAWINVNLCFLLANCLQHYWSGRIKTKMLPFPLQDLNNLKPWILAASSWK